MAYQVGIFCHASLMDDYKLIDYHTAETEEECKKWAGKWYKNHLPKEEPDPENPISDLYYDEIIEV